MSMCSHQHLHERESSQRAKVSSSAVLAVPLVPSNTPCTSPRVSSPLLGYTATRATSPSHGNHVMRALGYKWDFDGRKPWSTLPPPATTPSVLLTNDVLVPPRDPVSGGCINRPTPSQVVVQVAGRDGGDDARSPHPARRSGLPFGQRRWNNVLAEMSIKSGAVADCRRKARLPSVAIGYVAYRPPVYRCRYISGQRSN
ncbi:hypothetical protein LSAT2_011092 [Lamellibrachia satsuma]|nr:hypothetical protein LSAT2_011092 [Lamellibrachia satsuma]